MGRDEITWRGTCGVRESRWLILILSQQASGGSHRRDAIAEREQEDGGQSLLHQMV